jgi:hypothetical protein
MALGLILLPAVASSFWHASLVDDPDRRAHGFRPAAIGLLSFHRPAVRPGIVLFASLLPGLAADGRAPGRMRLSRPVHLRG